jgi:glycerol-3-phosphate acyltransferase PlsY
MMDITPLYYAIIAGAYLLGSVPFGLVLCRLCGYGDIRNIGSGNIGATNVLRTGNKFLALATLVLDSGKGAVAVFAADILTGGNFIVMMWAAFFALLGHLYPVWLKFKGGKGVATTLGTLLALAPWVGAASCLIWLITAALFRYSSLAALVAIGLSPLISSYIYDSPNLAGLLGVITLLVYFKHRDNIKRLFSGHEPKIGAKKPDAI